jgi:hypothetical protein
VIVDGRAHLDLLDLDDLLLLARFGGFFLLFVFVFAVVHQFDHGRFGFGRHLNQVVPALFCNGAGFVGADLAKFVSVIADQKNRARGNLFIDAGSVLGRGWGRLLKTSRDYDSLLLNARESTP